MMRQLQESDRHQVLTYLSAEPNENIFLIGDIERIGFDADFQQVYATFDNHNAITSVFLRYRDNGVFYTKEDHTVTPYLDIIQHTTFHHFSCKESLVSQVVPYLTGFHPEIMYFCAYTAGSTEGTQPTNISLVATEEDAGLVYDLLAQITEFSTVTSQTREAFIHHKLDNIARGMGMTNFILKDGIAVATAATTAETSQSAMVVAVATHPDYRNQGYASAVMIDLIARYNEKNKNLCLFYNNPNAGSIYHRIGFVDIGKWAVIEETKS